MTTAELKEYLGIVVQVEKDVDTQKRLCQKLSYEETECHEKITSITNAMEKLHEPIRREKHKESAKSQICTGVIMLVLFGIFYFIAVFLVEHHLDQNILVDFLTLAAIADMFLGFFFLLSGMVSYSGASKRDSKAYNDEVSAYEAAQRNNLARSQQLKQLEHQKQVAEIYYQKTEKQLMSSEQNLRKLYDYDIIFTKYRNYVMVSSLYEYLCAGRCTTLEGHEGAYNILELEIRLDRIITQLDRILQNLAVIQANQYTLYSCLQDSNQKIDMLLQEENRMADGILHLGTQASAVNARLESLQKSSELTSYLTECNQRELHYMNRMNYLAGNYDNPYGNYSPV